MVYKRFMEKYPVPRFEGAPYQGPTGIIFDSYAAGFLSRWSISRGLAGTDGRRLAADGDHVNEIVMNPHVYVKVGNGGIFDSNGIAATFDDGSKVLAVLLDIADDGEDAPIQFYRLTGEVTDGMVCYVDHAYEPPVASAHVPHPGNMEPRIPSLIPL